MGSAPKINPALRTKYYYMAELRSVLGMMHTYCPVSITKNHFNNETVLSCLVNVPNPVANADTADI